jgi:hypothetical protein
LAGHVTLVHTPPAQLAAPVIRPSAEAWVVKIGAGIDKLKMDSAEEANTIIIHFIDILPYSYGAQLPLNLGHRGALKVQIRPLGLWRRAEQGNAGRRVRWPGSAGHDSPQIPVVQGPSRRPLGGEISVDRMS